MNLEKTPNLRQILVVNTVSDKKLQDFEIIFPAMGL